MFPPPWDRQEPPEQQVVRRAPAPTKKLATKGVAFAAAQVAAFLPAPTAKAPPTEVAVCVDARRPDAAARIAARVQREWTRLLVPNGLDRSIRLWDNDDELLEVSAVLPRRPVEAVEAPAPAPIPTEAVADRLRPAILDPFPVTRCLDERELLPPEHDVAPEDDALYMGPEARSRYFKQLRLVEVQRDVLRTDDDENLGERGKTPRQEYLRAVLEDRSTEGTLPMPVLLRRHKKAPRTLDLSGAGVGDNIAVALTRVIDKLPDLDTLLLKDNRLTDTSLTPMCTIACELPGLTALDLSGNDMDESAKALRLYLAQPTCHLRQLWLNKSDIDDYECADFMKAVRSNRSLTVLSMSNNLVGENETRNTVDPMLVTGGKAIGGMLRDNATLTDLDVSWNKIRRESAISLATALGRNACLTRLNLAHNGLAETAQYLGLALSENVTLKDLDVSFNAIKPKAALVLAGAFHTNHTLERLDVSGNPVGKRGGEALVTAVRRFQLPDRALMIHLANADLDVEDGGIVFNPTAPAGDYTLDMATPYARMVARELYRLATTHHGCTFARIVHHRDGAASREVHLKRRRDKRQAQVSQLESVGSPENAHLPWYAAAQALDAALGQSSCAKAEDDPAVVDAMKKLLETAESSQPCDTCVLGILRHFNKYRRGSLESLLFQVFMGLFDALDTNRSGTIEVQELCRGLHMLGLPDASMETATHIMATYDVNNTKRIERNEFVHWAMGALLSRKLEKLDGLVDAATSETWVPPTEGTLCVAFVAEPRLPGSDMHGSDLGNRGLIRNIQAAASDIDRGRLFDKALTNTDIYFSVTHAKELLAECHVGLTTLEMLVKLLPVMRSPDDACALLDTTTDLQGKLQLRQMHPALFDACTGNPTGSYVLDLRDENDRKACMKLAAIDADLTNVAKSAGRRDTSQKGNWRGFRNEFLDDKPFEITTQWFTSLPRRGKLRFDFVTTRRPNKSTTCALSVRRFVSLSRILKLDELKLVKRVYEGMGAQTRKRTSFYASTAKRASARADTPNSNDDQPMDSSNDEDEGDDESSSDDEEDHPSDDVVQNALSSVMSTPPRRRSTRKKTMLPRRISSVLGVRFPPWLLRRDVVARWRTDKISTHLKCDWLGLEKARDTAKVLGIEDTTQSKPARRSTRPSPKPAATPQLQRRIAVMPDYNIDGAAKAPDDAVDVDEYVQYEFVPSKFTKSDAKTAPCRAYSIVYYKLALLRVATMSAWLTCEQIIFVVKHFPIDDFARVFAAVVLHARALDLDNYWRVYAVLEPQEQVELIHRLGWLNVLNPMCPDRVYCMDLRWWDHRELCKVLVKLAIEEPGTNWIHESYRWSIFDVDVPGWELPYSWCLEDHELRGEGGPRRFGRLRLRYTSDPKLGCEPNIPVREQLKPRFLCSHNFDIFDMPP